MNGIAEAFRALYDATGINFSVLYDLHDRAQWVAGIGMTIKLVILTVVPSLVLGLAGAILCRSGNWLVRLLNQIYVQVFRNTPPLAQIYLFYFAISPIFQTLHADGVNRPNLSSMTWAVISLSLLQGAFTIEILRAGLLAVPKELRDASDALGISRVAYFLVTELPLAIRISLPALQSNVVNSIKTTSLAYAIGVPEMFYAANQIWSDKSNVAEMMVTYLICNAVLVGAVSLIFKYAEARMRVPGHD